MKFENTEVWGFKHALRGMRNPLNSWAKSDSTYDSEVKIGSNDLKLAQILIKAGNEHRKFLRQIFVSVDITAPMYWWNEFDTYKVGTSANSTSKMHKLSSTPITAECFEMTAAKLSDVGKAFFEELEKMRIKSNEYRKEGNIEKANNYWKALIQLLPESYLQKRTVTMNYENILSMIKQRKCHKLCEWSADFIEWTKTLPYADEFFIKPFEK